MRCLPVEISEKIVRRAKNKLIGRLTGEADDMALAFLLCDLWKVRV
jgi:hypothetical protein